MEGLAFAQERKLFARLESVASYAALNEEDRNRYDADLKAYRDMMGQLEYAMAQGMAQGIEKGMAQGMEKGMEKGMAQGIEKGMAQGIEKGMAQGIEKGKMEMIVGLGQIGMSISDIAKVACISESRVREILKS